MSELRQDIISGDWAIIAPGRAARPKFLDAKRPARKPTLLKDCPFEESFLQTHGDWPPIARIPDRKNWDLILVPNKYPVLAPSKVCSVALHDGIYLSRTGVGDHDLIITRDHRKNFADLAPAKAEQVFTLFQGLCEQAKQDPCTVYAVPFWNWGPLAGASIWHPHYQFLSLPIVPAHSARSLTGALSYFKKKHVCAQCEVIRFERKEKKRIIAENANAIAVAHYAAKFPFEVRIIPKRHETYFHRAKPEVIKDVVRLTQEILRMMKRNLNDPDLNAFIHEAPLDDKSHDYHHWHVEIIPRVTTPAGFEFSTGIYINSTAPEHATEILRG